MRKTVLWGVLALILVAVNMQIYRKERILAEGETMLLRLAPRDPRSLLQGDYMSLNYSLANQISREFSNSKSAEGRVVVRLDENRVADFLRIENPEEDLAPDEKRLFFRKRGSVVKLGSDAFFFQEGTGRLYNRARYGELRVAADGVSVLVGLRDENFSRFTAEGADKVKDIQR